MTRILPIGTNGLNNPSHAFLHRVISVDTESPQSSVDVDASGNVTIAANLYAGETDLGIHQLTSMGVNISEGGALTFITSDGETQFYSDLAGRLAVSNNISKYGFSDYNSLTQDRTFTYPDKNGTLVMTDDISDFINKSTLDAYTILGANVDNTPVSISISLNSVLGRIGGDFTSISIDNDLTTTSTNDDTIPSAKAVKTYTDLMIPKSTIKTTINDCIGIVDAPPSASLMAITYDGLAGLMSGTYTAAKTNAINSATTVINVSSAAAPSLGQVLTATDSTHATWQTPVAGVNILQMQVFS